MKKKLEGYTLKIVKIFSKCINVDNDYRMFKIISIKLFYRYFSYKVKVHDLSEFNADCMESAVRGIDIDLKGPRIKAPYFETETPIDNLKTMVIIIIMDVCTSS